MCTLLPETWHHLCNYLSLALMDKLEAAEVCFGDICPRFEANVIISAATLSNALGVVQVAACKICVGVITFGWGGRTRHHSNL